MSDTMPSAPRVSEKRLAQLSPVTGQFINGNDERATVITVELLEAIVLDLRDLRAEHAALVAERDALREEVKAWRAHDDEPVGLDPCIEDAWATTLHEARRLRAANEAREKETR